MSTYTYHILSAANLWAAEMDIRRILRCERNQCPVFRTASYQQIRIAMLYHRRPTKVIAGPFKMEFEDGIRERILARPCPHWTRG